MNVPFCQLGLIIYVNILFVNASVCVNVPFCQGLNLCECSFSTRIEFV